MPKLRKKVLCYTLKTQREHSYDHLLLRVYYCKEQDLQLLMAGTIENRAGYGSPEAAARMGRWFLSLIEEGHRILLAPLSSYDAPPALTLDWQVYLPDRDDMTPGYCEMRVRGLDSYSEIKMGAKELNRIGTKIEKTEAKRRDRSRIPVSNRTFKDPVEVINALEAMGAKPIIVRHGEGEHRYQVARIYSPQPREWLLTDTLWRIFGIPL